VWRGHFCPRACSDSRVARTLLSACPQHPQCMQARAKSPPITGAEKKGADRSAPGDYCTVSSTVGDFTVLPSVAVTVTVYVPDAVTGAGGGVLLPPPPQAISSPSSVNDTPSPTTAEYRDTFRPSNPTIAMPATGNANGSHGECRSARCCSADPIPVFGPVVVMVKETAVAPEVPAAIVAGLNVQLDTLSVASVGENEQPNVTAPPNVAAPTGVAVKWYGMVVCPAFTVCVASLLVQVKSGAITVTVAAVALVDDAVYPSPP
jgi:hypothetical protein